MNPLLNTFQTIHGTFPFRSITVKDIEEALLIGMEEEKEEIRRITDNPEHPTFENTIIAFVNSGKTLEKATALMYNLSSAETNPELDSLMERMAVPLSEHSSEIFLNSKLYNRIGIVKKDAGASLLPEDKTLLKKIFESFEKSGATLTDDKKEQFRELSNELSQLVVAFSQNHLKETNNFQLLISDEKDLAGLPDTQKEQARQAALEKGMEGWLFTLHAPSYQPFMTYAENRELRHKMYIAYNTQCTQGEYNNFTVVSRIVEIRRKMAKLLGYDTFADYVLTYRMAENKKNVYSMLHHLLEAYLPKAKEEVKEIEALAKQMEGKDFQLQSWDFSYYSHKLQLQKYQIDAEILRPYFELSQVKKGIFELANRLYGITFKQNADIQVYHPDVEAYEVFDADGTFLAVFYCDFFPREGKQSGAWMTNYKEQWKEGTKNSRPHVSIVTNFTKPTAECPALLTLSEVETFLHEFGHALHGIFSNTTYAPLSGTNVSWDFVELPSQLMENYATDERFLDTFARHYKTGELLPRRHIENIKKSRTYNAGYACVRQVSFGLLDMAYYTQEETFSADVLQFEKEVFTATRLMPENESTCMSVQFGHIMSGGYAAGYYSYKWAEILDADAFEYFSEEGIFNQDIARKFRDNILSKGSSLPPMELYVRFRGRKPTIEALMKRDGILSNK